MIGPPLGQARCRFRRCYSACCKPTALSDCAATLLDGGRSPWLKRRSTATRCGPGRDVRRRCDGVCRPLAPHAAVLVAARDDAYVAVQSTEAIAARWRGSELWHAEGGHVSSFLLLNPLYLKAISRSLDKLRAQDGASHVLPDGARAVQRAVLPSVSRDTPPLEQRGPVSAGG